MKYNILFELIKEINLICSSEIGPFLSSLSLSIYIYQILHNI